MRAGLVIAAAVLPSVLNDGILDGIVGGEVDGLVAPLSHHGRDDAPPQRPDALLPNDEGGGLRGIGVLATGGLQRLQLLRLHPYLANLGRRYYQHRLGQAGRQTRHKVDRSRILLSRQWRR